MLGWRVVGWRVVGWRVVGWRVVQIRSSHPKHSGREAQATSRMRVVATYFIAHTTAVARCDYPETLRLTV